MCVSSTVVPGGSGSEAIMFDSALYFDTLKPFSCPHPVLDTVSYGSSSSEEDYDVESYQDCIGTDKAVSASKHSTSDDNTDGDSLMPWECSDRSQSPTATTQLDISELPTMCDVLLLLFEHPHDQVHNCNCLSATRYLREAVVNISECSAEEVAHTIDDFLSTNCDETEGEEEVSGDHHHSHHDKMVVYVGHTHGDHSLRCGRDTGLSADRLGQLAAQSLYHCPESSLYINVICSCTTGSTDTFKRHFDRIDTVKHRQLTCNLWQSHCSVHSLLCRKDMDYYRHCESILDSYEYVCCFD
jgi:hypothetical protein